MGAERIDLGRRALLAGGLLGITAPAWIGRAFAGTLPTMRERELFEAWHTGHRAGRPLLVVVVPEGDEWRRGQLLGATLNHASDGLLAALSRFQPACATRADLSKLGVELSGDPWFAIVTTAALPATVTPIAGPAPDTVDAGEVWSMDDDAVDAWIGAIHAVLLTSLGAGGDAEAGKALWVPDRLPGAYWAHAGGCGTTIEGVTSNVAFGCGMGHVPAKARRMLYFFDPNGDE